MLVDIDLERSTYDLENEFIRRQANALHNIDEDSGILNEPS